MTKGILFVIIREVGIMDRSISRALISGEADAPYDAA